jgi:hypothetical protein
MALRSAAVRAFLGTSGAVKRARGQQFAAASAPCHRAKPLRSRHAGAGAPMQVPTCPILHSATPGSCSSMPVTPSSADVLAAHSPSAALYDVLGSGSSIGPTSPGVFQGRLRFSAPACGAGLTQSPWLSPAPADRCSPMPTGRRASASLQQVATPATTTPKPPAAISARHDQLFVDDPGLSTPASFLTTPAANLHATSLAVTPESLVGVSPSTDFLMYNDPVSSRPSPGSPMSLSDTPVTQPLSPSSANRSRTLQLPAECAAHLPGSRGLQGLLGVMYTDDPSSPVHSASPLQAFKQHANSIPDAPLNMLESPMLQQVNSRDENFMLSPADSRFQHAPGMCNAANSQMVPQMTASPGVRGDSSDGQGSGSCLPAVRRQARSAVPCSVEPSHGPGRIAQQRHQRLPTESKCTMPISGAESPAGVNIMRSCSAPARATRLMPSESGMDPADNVQRSRLVVRAAKAAAREVLAKATHASARLDATHSTMPCLTSDAETLSAEASEQPQPQQQRAHPTCVLVTSICRFAAASQSAEQVHVHQPCKHFRAA